MSELIAEPALARRLGVGRTTVRDIRRDHLTQGDHWVIDGGKVTYTPEGVDAVLRAVNAKKTGEAAGTGAEQGGAVIEAGDGLPVRDDSLLEATVTEWRYPNRRILTADAGGRLVRVRVHDNTKYRPGMVMRVQLDPGRTDIGSVVGRGPRYPGRW